MLFGSFVKGKANGLSDIDIAVILEKVNPEIEAEIGSMYSKDIDVVLFHRVPLYFKYEILKTGIPIFVRDETKLKEVIFKTMKRYLEHAWLYDMFLKGAML